jgi:hypothetical protein
MDHSHKKPNYGTKLKGLHFACISARFTGLYMCAGTYFNCEAMFTDMRTLLIATVFGLIGMLAVGRGKRELNYGLIFAGAGLIFFPYLVPSLFWMVVIGLLLTAVAWWASLQ